MAGWVAGWVAGCDRVFTCSPNSPLNGFNAYQVAVLCLDINKENFFWGGGGPMPNQGSFSMAQEDLWAHA